MQKNALNLKFQSSSSQVPIWKMWQCKKKCIELELEFIARTIVIGLFFGPFKVGAFISSWGHVLPPPSPLGSTILLTAGMIKLSIDFIYCFSL